MPAPRDAVWERFERGPGARRPPWGREQKRAVCRPNHGTRGAREGGGGARSAESLLKPPPVLLRRCPVGCLRSGASGRAAAAGPAAPEASRGQRRGPAKAAGGLRDPGGCWAPVRCSATWQQGRAAPVPPALTEEDALCRTPGDRTSTLGPISFGAQGLRSCSRLAVAELNGASGRQSARTEN